MDATRAPEQSQDSMRQDSKRQDSKSQDSKSLDSKRQYKSLHDRYGKIGIPAVAAAVRHTDDQRRVRAPRLVPQDFAALDSD